MLNMLYRAVRFIKIALGLRCKGDCCKHFFLPSPPSELKELAILEAKSPAPIFNNNPTEMQTVANMVELVEVIDNKHYYKCNNLKNGDCSIYKTRPVVCSGYPSYNALPWYNKRNIQKTPKCDFLGCTWSKAGVYNLLSNTLFKTASGCKNY